MSRVVMLLALAALVAGCATTEPSKKEPPARPAESAKSVEPVLPELTGDPNPFADYGPAMASDAKLPMAVEWHNRNAAALAKETDVESLKRLASSSADLENLLAQVKPDYQTDPMTAVRIAAVSQIAMCRKWDGAPAARERWTALLLEASEKASDAYRKMFFLDQLRWCGKAEQADRVIAIGRKAGAKSVEDFAKMVAVEMKGVAR